MQTGATTPIHHPLHLLKSAAAQHHRRQRQAGDCSKSLQAIQSGCPHISAQRCSVPQTALGRTATPEKNNDTISMFQKLHYQDEAPLSIPSRSQTKQQCKSHKHSSPRALMTPQTTPSLALKCDHCAVVSPSAELAKHDGNGHCSLTCCIGWRDLIDKHSDPPHLSQNTSAERPRAAALGLDPCSLALRIIDKPGCCWLMSSQFCGEAPGSHLLHLLNGSLLGRNLRRPDLCLMLLHLLGVSHLAVRLHLGLHLLHAHPCLALQLCYVVLGPLQCDTHEYSSENLVMRLMLLGTRCCRSVRFQGLANAGTWCSLHGVLCPPSLNMVSSRQLGKI